jgi:amidophosphoribosyltransferase
MCGIVAIVLRAEQAAPVIVDALTTLQHRGQDAAGVAVSEGYQINLHKSNGQVSDLVEQKTQMNLLEGRFGIGHVRYPTAGSSSESEAQPFYTSCPFGVALAHNGNLTNTAELQRYCRLAIRRQLNTGSDSETCLGIFADELFKALKRKRHVSKSATGANSDDDEDEEDDAAGMESLDEGQDVPHPAIDSVFEAVTKCMKRFEGAYAIVALINGLGVVGFRDPHGIRPLAYGTRKGPHGMDSILASESVAVEIPGFDFERDVAPGEAVLIDRRGNVHTKQCMPTMSLAPCIFEYVYFARQDSVIDGISVYTARRRMGEFLAHQIRKKYPDEKIDVVVPVPATSRISAIQCAITLGVPYEEG